MARGRKPGVKIHEAATALYREFTQLPEEEQTAFFNKYFGAALRGASADVKDDVKTKFTEIQVMIAAHQNEEKNRELLKGFSVEMLQAELEKRKAQAKPKKSK